MGYSVIEEFLELTRAVILELVVKHLTHFAPSPGELSWYGKRRDRYAFNEQGELILEEYKDREQKESKKWLCVRAFFEC